MRIGVPKESKDREFRAGLTPAGARELVAHGHTVLVQSGTGRRIGMPDDQYQAAGCRIVPEAADVFAEADVVVKVKELQAHERGWLRAGQVLFTYLHLAADLVIGAVLEPDARTPAGGWRNGGAHEARRRGRRHRHRPGGVLRDLAPDQPLRADLCARQRHPLLCDEHARCRRPDIHARADAGYAALHRETGGPGMAPSPG